MSEQYLVALDILTTHGGSREAAWEVAGELLAVAPLEAAFLAVATAETDQRVTEANRIRV